jgi:hypothetical protein
MLWAIGMEALHTKDGWPSHRGLGWGLGLQLGVWYPELCTEQLLLETNVSDLY